jgi:hypothetical protein
MDIFRKISVAMENVVPFRAGLLDRNVVLAPTV